MEQLIERFNRTFANVPIPERHNTIFVDDLYGPMSWYVVRLEVQSRSKIAVKALQFMDRQHFI